MVAWFFMVREELDMTIVVEQFPDDPIIFVNMTEPMDYYKEIPEMFSHILELRETIQDRPKYYLVIDMTGIKADFSEIIFALGEARKTSQKRRPDLPVDMHLVGSGELFELVANALAQLQYGGYSAPLHKTAEEAMNLIQADLAKPN
jgi:hypothetical protein